MFISHNQLFTPPVRVTLCVTLNKYNHLWRMLDWRDCLYLCVIIHFLQRMPATARNTSIETIIETHRRWVCVMSAFSEEVRQSLISEKRNHSRFCGIATSSTCWNPADNNGSEISRYVWTCPPAACRWGPSLWLNPACRSWTFNGGIAGGLTNCNVLSSHVW